MFLFFFFSRGYSQQLQAYQQLCASMLSEINSSLECLGEIAKLHGFVNSKTGALHSACEKLIEDQVQFKVDCWKYIFIIV